MLSTSTFTRELQAHPQSKLLSSSDKSYSYNKGDKVVGLEFGDHIGDWLASLSPSIDISD